MRPREGWENPTEGRTDGNPTEAPPTGETGGSGCAEGLVLTTLDADGNIMLDREPECVTPEEADNRRNKHAPGWETGTSPTEPKPGGGGGTPGFRPASPFPTLSPWQPGKAPTFETPGFVPPEGFEAPKWTWNRELKLTPLKFDEQYQPPTYEQATSDPGYQFRVKEGQRAIENSAAARGALRTGATLKGLSDYNQNAASQEYGNVFNRYNTGFNTRFGVAQALNENQQNIEAQEYKNAFDAFAAQFAANYTGKKDEWNSAFELAKEKFDTEFARQQAAFAPKLVEWQTNEEARRRQWELEFAARQQQWLWNNPNATAILEAGLR